MYPIETEVVNKLTSIFNRRYLDAKKNSIGRISAEEFLKPVFVEFAVEFCATHRLKPMTFKEIHEILTTEKICQNNCCEKAELIVDIFGKVHIPQPRKIAEEMQKNIVEVSVDTKGKKLWSFSKSPAEMSDDIHAMLKVRSTHVKEQLQ